MPLAALDKVRLYYEEQGEGSPILFLHNCFGTLRTWDVQREFLSRYYRVILLDIRGHGRKLRTLLTHHGSSVDDERLSGNEVATRRG